jgi:hypothetical protein
MVVQLFTLITTMVKQHWLDVQWLCVKCHGKIGPNRAIGTRIHCAKLTDEMVVLIRRKYRLGLSISELARRFMVDRKCIRNVVNRITWRHIGQ